MYISLRWKLTLLFSIFAAVILFGAAGVFYLFARQTIEENTLAELNATAFEKKAAIERWVNERRLDLETIAQTPIVIDAVSSLLRNGENQNSIYKQKLLDELNSRNEGGLAFLELSVLNSQTGKVIASTYSFNEGKSQAGTEYFINGLNDFYLMPPFLDSTGKQPMLLISMPIRTADGQLVSVLLGRLNPDLLQEIVARRVGLRSTSEAYLITPQKEFITLPQQTSETSWRTRQDSSPLGVNCLPQTNGSARVRDYRSQRVVAVYHWVESLDLCLFAKVDEAEAFRPLKDLERGILAAALGALALALLAAFFLARTLVRPINVLKNSALQLIRGDYDLHARMDTNDEIGLLANAFNSMATAISEQDRTLRAYAFELEKRVDERTLALQASEALSRAVIENSPVGLTVRDKAGHLVKGNEAWARIGGISYDEALAYEKIEDRLPLAERFAYLGADIDKLMALYEKGGSLFIPEIYTQDPDPKAAQWVSQYFYGITNDKGEVERVVSLTQNITERKERERELEALVAMSIALRIAITRTEMLPIILNEIEKALSARATGVLLRDAVNSNLLHGIGTGPWKSWELAEYQPVTTGIAGEVLRSGQPYLTDNVHADPRLWGDYVGNVSAMALVPIIAREQTIGLIAIGGQTLFSEAKIRLLKAFADIAANALYRLMLYEQTERRLQWLTAIRSIDRAIMGSVDLKVILNILLDKTISQLDVDAADVLLLKRDNLLHYAAGRGFNNARPIFTSVRLGVLQAGRAALDRRTIVVEDYEAGAWKSPLMDDEKFHGYCAVPLIAKGEVKGVLEVFSTRLIARETEWLEFLESLAGLAAISVDNASIIESVQRSNAELTVAYEATLEGWARTIESRQRHEMGHSARLAVMTVDLARALGVPEADLGNIQRGALLHDVGTIAIPEVIWSKPGTLTPEERAILETHPVHSNEILAQIEWLQPALDIPYCHHEKWNGTGYPRRLRGEEIPLAARIFSVVEVWDALTHERPYRPAWTVEAALDHIRAEAGVSFDPRVVEAFLRLYGS